VDFVRFSFLTPWRSYPLVAVVVALYASGSVYSIRRR
jgi:hypothetical protein